MNKNKLNIDFPLKQLTNMLPEEKPEDKQPMTFNPSVMKKAEVIYRKPQNDRQFDFLQMSNEKENCFQNQQTIQQNTAIWKNFEENEAEEPLPRSFALQKIAIDNVNNKQI